VAKCGFLLEKMTKNRAFKTLLQHFKNFQKGFLKQTPPSPSLRKGGKNETREGRGGVKENGLGF